MLEIASAKGRRFVSDGRYFVPSNGPISNAVGFGAARCRHSRGDLQGVETMRSSDVLNNPACRAEFDPGKRAQIRGVWLDILHAPMNATMIQNKAMHT